jgi:PAS domain-containing protein
MSHQAPKLGEGDSPDADGAARAAAVARTILDASHEAFISMDPDGRVTDWNPLAEQTFGYARSEILGRDLSDARATRRSAMPCRRWGAWRGSCWA